MCFLMAVVRITIILYSIKYFLVFRYIETAELFYKELSPAAVINLVQAAAAPTVLEIATQHATAQRALLFSNHLQVLLVLKGIYS